MVVPEKSMKHSYLKCSNYYSPFKVDHLWEEYEGWKGQVPETPQFFTIFKFVDIAGILTQDELPSPTPMTITSHRMPRCKVNPESSAEQVSFQT